MCQLVPYSLKEKTEHKLEKLVRLGIYHPVASSTWAAPLVPVFTWEGDRKAVFKFAAIINRLLIRQPIVTNTLSQKPKIFLLN